MKDPYRFKVALNFWNSKSPYLECMLLNNDAASIDEAERPEILSYLPPFEGKDILELGSGIGRFTTEFAKKANHVTTLDFCPHFMESNKEKNRHFSNIEYLCKDAMDADFGPESFDLIFISWLQMYLSKEEVEIFSQRIVGWLKPKGAFFFRESCAPTTYFSKTEHYYAWRRSVIDYDRFYAKKLKLLKYGSIKAYEDLQADPFKCFWLYRKP